MGCEIGHDVGRAADIIRAGGLVGMPTETVYGLAADATQSAAVARIFEAKQRPAFDPLIVHIADTSWLGRVVRDFPADAVRLAETFWPGPLTIVLPKQPCISDLVTSGLPNVGVRVPRHPVAHELLRLCDRPIAAPSANLFGRISPTTAEHVAEQLADRIDYILDGGPCGIGVESTVVQILPQPCLLRPGGVSYEQLAEVVGEIAIAQSTDRPATEPQRAPGMLAQHYAPRTPLYLSPSGQTRAAVRSSDGHADSSQKGAERWGLLAWNPPPEGHTYDVIEHLSPAGDLREAAATLFAALRRLDAQSLTGIIAELVPETGLGRAINDRLRRAAAGR